MSPILLYALAVVIGTVAVFYGSQLLETSAEVLSRHYALPAAVHGAVVVAIGSSFPELSSAVLATLLHGEFELGLSTVVGSAIFNILFIPGVSRLVASENLQPEKLIIYKDAQFYIISVAVLLIVFSLAIIYYPAPDQELVGEITPMIALLPIMVYGLYVFIQYQEVRESKIEQEKADNLAAVWFKLLASLLMVLVGVEALLRAALFYEEFFNIPSFFCC